MKMDVEFSVTKETVDVNFSAHKQTFSAGYDSLQAIHKNEVYEGSYRVTPRVSNQTLDTANKLMKSDVVIEEIPYAEVSNNSGGKTATIGGN